MVRYDCRFFLRYGHRSFCKLPWQGSVFSDPADLELGCRGDCKNYEPLEWKRIAYRDEIGKQEDES